MECNAIDVMEYIYLGDRLTRRNCDVCRAGRFVV